MIDRGKLFSSVRVSVFGGQFKQSQVDGINFIIDAWERTTYTDLRWLAYMLGTAYAETAHTMQPVHEYGGDAYFKRRYDIEGENPGLAERLGNTEPGDGVLFAGRGFVQVTGRSNYLRLGKEIGVDLVAEPDRAMDPPVAASIMFAGMTKSHLNFDTTFSGVALDKYFNDDNEDWVGARHIINGTDHASMIAGYAQAFNEALDNGAPAPEAPAEPAVQPEPIAELLTSTSSGTGHQKAIGGGLAVQCTQLFDKVQSFFTGFHLDTDTLLLIASIAVALVVWKLRSSHKPKGT